MTILYKKFQDGGKAPEAQEDDIFSFYATNRGAEMNNLLRYFAAVSAHEARGRRTQQQLSGTETKPFKGPGTGMYQVEPASSLTATNQFKKLYRQQGWDLPEWFNKFTSTPKVPQRVYNKAKEKYETVMGYDTSVLGKPEQTELIMSSYLYGNPDTYMKEFLAGKIDAGQLWAKGHKRSGYTDEQIKKVNDYYNKQNAETVNNVLFKDNWDNPQYLKNPYRTQAASDYYITRADRFGYRCGPWGCPTEQEAKVDTGEGYWEPGEGYTGKPEEVTATQILEKKEKGGLLYKK